MSNIEIIPSHLHDARHALASTDLNKLIRLYDADLIEQICSELRHPRPDVQRHLLRPALRLAE